MKQLSGLDAAFLYLETPEMPMHVGALHLYELPPGTRGRFVTALRAHIASRLPAAPALRRKLWWMPLNIANPAWVDAQPDLRQHIVEVKLPKGAGLAELEQAVGRLHPVLLDRSRPLWKFHVFEGLAPGPHGERRLAVYTQLHHAAVDGQAAVALANAIMDLTPEGHAPGRPASRRPRVYRLGLGEMLRGVIGNQATKVLHIVRGLPSTVGTLKDAAVQAAGGLSLLGGEERPSNLTLAPRTPLNVSVTGRRAFATVGLPLAEAREIGHAHGATINDVVLWVCSSALRRHYAKKRKLPKASLIAAVPITLRPKGDTTSDNQASMSLVSLGTHLADALERLEHVKAATRAMKSTMGSLKSVLPTDFPSLGIPWLIEAATALYGKARVADRIPQVANVVISNVPGPPVPLYMAGARMLTNYPTSIVVHGVALNVTVQSYDQNLDFGLMADAEAMPDVRDLAEAMRVAFDDLRALPRPGDADHPDTEPSPTLMRRAQRSLGDAVGKVAQGVVGRTLDGAMAQVQRRVTRPRPARPAQAPADAARGARRGNGRKA